MAEKSWPWDTNPPTGGAGDGSAGLNEAGSREMLSLYFRVQDPSVEGVSKGVLGELAVTGSASPLSVATGSAVCYGLYTNDASVNVAVSTPSVGTTGGRVVLQTNWSGTGGASLEARTRIALKMSADGVATIPALTQSSGTTWEISLATFTITTGGAITVTDDRTFRRSTSIVNTSEIEDDAITSAKLATNSVTSDAIAANAVGSSEIAASAVGSSEIATGAVDTDELATGAVTQAKIADDSVDDAKIEHRVAKVVKRQGNAPTSWKAAGTTTYTPTDVLEQVGVINVGTISASSTGSVTVTFPQAFTETPIVLFNVQKTTGSSNAWRAQIQYPTGNTTTVTFDVYNDDPSNSGSFQIYWRAIGGG